MKLTAKFNLKKGLVMGLLAALPMFNACEKTDPAPEPTPVTPTDTTTPVTPVVQKHNVELVYGANVNTAWQNISLDTIRKYNADETVDTIFMIPELYNQYSTVSTNGLQSVITRLRERYNVNPAKVRGKGELQLWNQAVLDNPEIVRFFADTLKYNVTYRNTAKSR